MASYFKLVENEDDLKTFFEAGMLWYKYIPQERYTPEGDTSWDRLLSDWKRRGSAGGWESYVLVEDDTEEATCPSP